MSEDRARHSIYAQMESAPSVTDEQEFDSLTDEDTPWVVLVWNDPINSMATVLFFIVWVQRRCATELMLDVSRTDRGFKWTVMS